MARPTIIRTHEDAEEIMQAFESEDRDTNTNRSETLSLMEGGAIKLPNS